MWNLLKSLFFQRNEQLIAELERDYLNASVSRVDLERREREIDRGLFRRDGTYA